jgi:ribose transport system substrate-binding protein
MYRDATSPPRGTRPKERSMRKPIAALAALASASLVLAACAMPADDPNFIAGGSVDGSGEGVISANDAQSVVDQALVAPTSIGIDTPLAAPPAAGAVIVGLSDGTEEAKALDASMAAAAAALGWTYEVIEGAGTPDGAIAAFDEALAKKPAGIHIDGGYVDYLVDGLAKATTDGVPVVCTGCIVDPLDALKDTSIAGKAEVDGWGTAVASYIQVNSAQDAVLQLFSYGTGAAAQFNQGLQAALLQYCEPCSTTENLIDLADPTMLPADVISLAMQLDPLVNWASFAPGALSATLGDALTAAGIAVEGVKVVGWAPTAANIAATAAGTEAAWMGFPTPVVGWRVMDQFARIIGGEEIVVGPLPAQLLTAETAGTAALDADGNFIGVSDYEAQFKALWGVK